MGRHFQIDQCEFCGRDLPERAATGRPRRFCRDSCRSAARRARECAFASESEPVGDSPEVVEAFLVGRAANPDDQVLAAVDGTLRPVVAPTVASASKRVASSLALRRHGRGARGRPPTLLPPGRAMTRGRKPDPQRAERGTGNRPQTGKKTTKIVPQVVERTLVEVIASELPQGLPRDKKYKKNNTYLFICM